MTFALLGRCARTDQLGAVVATSDVAVGARVPFAEARVGAILTQHRTDPRLGLRGLALLRSGCSASETIAALVASTAHHSWRQIAALDVHGGTASFSGDHVRPLLGESHGQECVALGNSVASERVTEEMIDAFIADSEPPLAERLVRALEAGLAAGGEPVPVLSAALLVVDVQPFPLVDLRVDLADEAVVALRRLWDHYRAWVDEFVVRAVDPDAAKGIP